MSQNESSNKNKKIDKIKSSFFSRGLSLAKISISTGAKVAGYGISQMLKENDNDGVLSQVLKSQAKMITNELGELKGSLMKAGQLLSTYGEHFLPAEANQFLKTLQFESPSLEWPEIKKVIDKNLSAELISELEIEHNSLASASMGQVHRATIKSTGEQVVLKVQYPGVDKAIDNDLKALKFILNSLKLLPKDLNLDPIFAEVRDMLVQETNYKTEAELTQFFYEKFADNDQVIVPKVYPRYSTNKILCTSYEEGIQADSPQVLNLAQEERNQLASLFLDIYLREVFLWGTVQTDPHLGNYKVRLDSSADKKHKIILLDFGATRVYDPQFLKSYKQMVRSALFKDPVALREAALQLRFIQEGDDPKLVETFEKFCLQIVEPFQNQEYDWKNTDLPERLSKQVFYIIQNFKLRTPPKEVLFLDRKTGGVFIFLSVLKAKMNSRELIEKYLK